MTWLIWDAYSIDCSWYIAWVTTFGFYCEIPIDYFIIQYVAVKNDFSAVDHRLICQVLQHYLLS